MYFGEVALGGNVELHLLVTSSGQVPQAPDDAPTFSIYEGGQDTPLTDSEDVSMTQKNSKTGFYAKQHACTARRGFEAGKTYTVKFEWQKGGSDKSELATFTVV